MSSKAVVSTHKKRASADKAPGFDEEASAFSTPLPEKLASLLNEIRWLLLTAIAAFLALALWGYHPADPGWSVAVHYTDIYNPVGIAGAWLSNLLFFLFGLSAWWWVFLPLFVGWLGFRRFATAEEAPDRRHIIIAAFGFVLLLLSSCGIERLRFSSIRIELPQQDGAGGMCGMEISRFVSHYFGLTGATLVFLALFAVGWSLFSGMSWINVAESIGSAIENTFLFCRNTIGRWQDRRIGREIARERDVNVASEKKRTGDFEPVRIEVDTTVPGKPSAKLEKRIRREKQPALFPEVLIGGRLPALNLLASAATARDLPNANTLEFTSRLIERKLADFGVEVRVISAYPGPVITRYELEPAIGVKGSQIVNLARDLARALALVSIRVVETVPGKSCMALELPNPKRQIVRLTEIIASKTYNDTNSPLTITLGKDISGHPIVADLTKMPHLLVAGTTGSGKSVAINAMILSLLYKSEPEQVRLILVDPKMLELSVYEGIPHLLTPVVTDMRKAANALNWCTGEMDRRYKIMSKLGVRNLAGANALILEAEKNGEKIDNPLSLTPNDPEPLKPLPYIVVIIDELADLMMVVGKKVEELIARLAQKARASGIHLILATQRPSVDVITGLIKANFPTRIAFQVSSKVDSRTILDQMGAEALLGQGDMLYLPPGSGYPQRVHGAFVADEEVHRVVDFLKSTGTPEYVEDLVTGGNGDDGDFEGGDFDNNDDENDELYDQAVDIVLKSRRASISLVQRHLRIGYNRAARMIEAMERAGLVSEIMDSRGGREVLAPRREED